MEDKHGQTARRCVQHTSSSGMVRVADCNVFLMGNATLTMALSCPNNLLDACSCEKSKFVSVVMRVSQLHFKGRVNFVPVFLVVSRQCSFEKDFFHIEKCESIY